MKVDKLNKSVPILLLLLAAAFILSSCGCESKDSDNDDINDDSDDTDNDDIDDDDDTDDDDDIVDGWHIYKIDSDEGIYFTTSIGVDSNNHMHIIYYDNLGANYGLKYATNSSGGWQKFKLDGGGSFNSIALDSDNNVHVSYSFFTIEDKTRKCAIKYATNKMGSWQTAEVAKVVLGGEGDMYDPSNSIALDSDGNTYISYYYCGWAEEFGECSPGDLRYATNGSGSWERFTVDSEGNTGWNSNAVFDSNGKLLITYATFDGDYMYATNSSGSWETSLIKGNAYLPSPINHRHMAIDSNDKLHVSFHNKYATNASGAWEFFDMPGGGVDNSIAVDSNNRVHISYTDEADRVLNYVTNKSGAWEVLTIDSVGQQFGGASIAIDSDDYAHISYHCKDGDASALKYATNRPPEE